jgi:puromycin-sensitive aminopeptidase
LKLVDAYRNEDNYTVWSSITNSLVKLQQLLTHTDVGDRFDAYGVKLYRPVAEKLGWNTKASDSHLDTLLRPLVLSRLVSFNCPKTVAEAKKRFSEHMAGNLLPADLRSTCYKAVLQTADTKVYNEMLHLYRATDLHEEKDRISRALGSIRDATLLNEVIKFATSEEVRAQDAVFVIVSVAMNPKGRDLCWNYFKENWKPLLDQYEVTETC